MNLHSFEGIVHRTNLYTVSPLCFLVSHKWFQIVSTAACGVSLTQVKGFQHLSMFTNAIAMPLSCGMSPTQVKGFQLLSMFIKA